MAIHRREIVLPDEEVRDVRVHGDRINLAAPAGSSHALPRPIPVPGLTDARRQPGTAEIGAPIDDARLVADGVLASDREPRRRVLLARRAGGSCSSTVGDSGTSSEARIRWRSNALSCTTSALRQHASDRYSEQRDEDA